MDITGQKFHRLTAIRRVENAPGGQARWLCRCDCGEETTVAGTVLRYGSVKSCGCLLREWLTGFNQETKRAADDAPGYMLAHKRTRRERGKASDHQCTDCDRIAHHWSLRKDASERLTESVGRDGRTLEYSRNPKDYEPRCGSCHRFYDNGES